VADDTLRTVLVRMVTRLYGDKKRRSRKTKRGCYLRWSAPYWWCREVWRLQACCLPRAGESALRLWANSMKLAPLSGTTNNNETMFEAQYLLNGDDVYSPWMSRVGDNLLATVDTVGVDGTGTKLEVRVYHKNTEDVGDGAVLGALIEVASAGRAWEEWQCLNLNMYSREPSSTAHG